MKTPTALRPVTGSSPALVSVSNSNPTGATRSRRWLLACALLFSISFFTLPAQALSIYVLTVDGKIASAPISNPSAISPGVAITGVTAGETLVGIDVRPQNQQLYALGVNPLTDTATLYRLSAETGFAAVVGTAGSIAFVDAVGAPVPFNDPAFFPWDIDFNPAADRLRVVSGSLNFRVNPNNGAPVDGNLNNGTPAGINPDGPINGVTPTVDATAYSNSQPNNGNITTQYTLDAATNALYIQNPPNAGTETTALPLTLAGISLNFTSVSGFDIPPGVNAPASNSPVPNGSGLAVLTVGGTSSLYTINLVNGAIISVSGAFDARSIAIRTELGAAIGLTADGSNLIRFATNTPGTTTTVALTGVTAGETLVGIDQRPQTGQLYALGVNATANTATLYLVDPQSAALTAVGTPGQIAYVTADGVTPVDLPDPATIGYGMDFNPTVDRLRVVTGSGLNFRVNPNTGAGVDGNAGTPGTNTDGSINGPGVIGVEATAYTNSFPRDLAVGLTTTQYTLNATSNTLFIQNPPNNGTQTSPLQVTLGGNPLDFTGIGGFDIPSSVTVSVSNTGANGDGWFVGTVGGTTGLYRINLATGAATFLGSVGAGATALAGLAVNTTPAVGVEFPAGTALYDILDEVEFGTTAIGNAVTNQITLTNTGSQALTYTTTLDGSASFQATANGAGTVAPGGSVLISVAFNPTEGAATSGTLHILTNDPLIPSFDLLLLGTGTVALTDDAIAVTGGDARIYVLANDGLSGDALITDVSDLNILIDGRTLIIPAGYTGTFTYTTFDNGIVGQGTVTVTAGTAVVNPATFSGLLRSDSGELAGSATVTISATGVATVQLIGGTAKAKTKIIIPAGDNTGVNISSLGLVTLTKNLNGTADLSLSALGGDLSGTLSAVNTAATPTKHHIALAALDPQVPGGGYAIAQGAAKGVVKITGLLPDGVVFSAGTAIRDNGTIAFYIPITKGLKRPAVIAGELVTANLAATDVTGEVTWLKLAQPAGAKGLHLEGVDTTLTANGSLYNGTVPLPSGNGTLTLSGGNLAGTETSPVVVSAAGIPATPAGSLTKWSGVKLKAGKFAARVTVPGLSKPAKGSGLYLPKSNRAWGYFPGTSVGGRIQLTVP